MEKEKSTPIDRTIEAFKCWVRLVMVKTAQDLEVFEPKPFLCQDGSQRKILEKPSLVVEYQSGLASAIVLFEDGLFKVKPKWHEAKEKGMNWDYSTRVEVDASGYFAYLPRVKQAILARAEALKKPQKTAPEG